MAARWTKDECDTLVRMAASGETGKAIARALDRPHNGVIGKAQELGIRLQKRPDFPPSSARILEALKSGPKTTNQLREELGMNGTTMIFAVKRLRAAKAVMISGYQRNKIGRPSQILSIGWGKEAKYPGPLSNAEVVSAYTKRKAQEDPLFWVRKYALRRKPRADPAAAWIRPERDEHGEVT